MAFIDTIKYEDASGELKAIYDDLIKSRGKLADVHTIQSLNPETIVSHMKLYMDIMFGQSPLKRDQREMIGVVVSAANNCSYCVLHHLEALLHYWKDEKRVDDMLQQSDTANLSEIDQALCSYTKAVTINPSSKTKERIRDLRKVGLDDRSILDATLVVSYFNFVNRIVLSLGLEVRAGEISGYTY